MTGSVHLSRGTAAVAAYLLVVRPRLLHWGATPREVRGPMRGDELVAAGWQTTRGVDIAAPASRVWPWLVQMGYGRGGWYSYDALERLTGAGFFRDGGSARRVIPELQRLVVGETVALSAVNGLTVVVCDPPTALVLHLRMSLLTGRPARPGDRAVLDWTWSFALTSTSSSSARLLVRVRASYKPKALLVPLVCLLEPVHFVMERKMLRTITGRCAVTAGPSMPTA